MRRCVWVNRWHATVRAQRESRRQAAEHRRRCYESDVVEGLSYFQSGLMEWDEWERIRARLKAKWRQP